MKFLDIAKKRYSCRSFLAKPVEKEILMKILEAGRVAPTGCNIQPQRIIVVQSKEGLEKVEKSTSTFGAPLVIIICGDKTEAWKRAYDDKNIVEIDASIVTDHMMLQAADSGIGSVWKCAFRPEVIVEEFNLPKNVVPINILVLGYPDTEPLSPDRHELFRKPIQQTVYLERYGNPIS